MFTGIVTEKGSLVTVERTAEGARLRIACRMAGEGLARGESISVSGACLTVEECDGRSFTVTASPETLRKTTLGTCRAGTTVNLERALALGDRMGGHLVQGHVDGVGRVREVRAEGVSRVLTLDAPEAVRPHLVDRGSVAVDGVSLTVTGVQPGSFQVTLIPATLAATTLASLRPGDAVNLEADVISKYVARHLLAAREAGAEAPAAWLAAGGRD